MPRYRERAIRIILRALPNSFTYLKDIPEVFRFTCTSTNGLREEHVKEAVDEIELTAG